MITRRCTQRQFLMRPDPATNNAFVYCLAVAAEHAGVQVLFTSAQSNHHHTGIYDPKGTYPEFIEHFHKLFAKCMNSLRGRWENFWSSEQTSVVPGTRSQVDFGRNRPRGTRSQVDFGRNRPGCAPIPGHAFAT
jgi:hypothetical protein